MDQTSAFRNLSIAGFWQPVTDSYLDANGRWGNLATMPYGVLQLDANGRAGILVSGWSWGGTFGLGESITPVNVMLLAEQADGTMAIETGSVLGNRTTNGSGSVIVADFNNDGRDDILLPAHNESPFIAARSTAYISTGSTGFFRVDLTDQVMAHDAQLAEIDGQPVVLTRTFQPGDQNPVYQFENGAFVANTSLTLSSQIYGMSIALSPKGTDGEQFLVVGDTGNPPSQPFTISVFRFENGDVVGDPTVLTPYLSTKPEYSGFVSEWGQNVTHTYRVWTDDFNHDGKTDILAGSSMWNQSDPRFPSVLEMLQNKGDLGFEDKTDSLNPDYSRATFEVDYSLQQVDLDGSGINSYLMAGQSTGESVNGEWTYLNDRQSNYLMLNDGTGRLHVALHDEFQPLGNSVIQFLSANTAVKAQHLYVWDNLERQGLPRFIAYQTSSGEVNYVAEVNAGSWYAQGTPDQSWKTTYIYVNIPLHYNVTTNYTKSIVIEDRNSSRLMRTFAGDDIIKDLNGSVGASIDGGLGQDTAVYSGSRASYSVMLQAGSVWKVVSQVGSNVPAVADALKNIEVLQFSDGKFSLFGGGGGNDAINGGAGNDILGGGAGHDTIDGGGGIDTAVYSGSRHDYIIKEGNGVLIVEASDGTDILRNINKLQFADEAFDVVIPGMLFAGSDSSDAVEGTEADDTLDGGFGNDTLSGSYGQDSIFGSDGDDWLDGGDGSDTLTGGNGIDVASYAQSRTAVQVSLKAGVAGIGGDAEGDVFYSIEILRGSSFNDGLTGNDDNNGIYGDAGSDNIDGGDGNDILDGGLGNDVLSGSLGNDTLLGAGGNDKLDGGYGDDTAVFSGNSTDYTVSETTEGLLVTHRSTKSVQTITEVEFYQFTDGTFNRAQLLAPPEPPVVTPSITVETTVSITLPEGSLNLVAGGSGNITLTGNALNNSITGNKGKNAINGGGGADKLNGSLGNDSLTGGAGKDAFVFSTKLGTSATDRKVNFDTIKDFSVKDDSLWLDNAIFKKLGSGTPTKPKPLSSKFFALDKAKDKDDYIIYNKKTGVLSYDVDGSGAKAAIEFAQVKKGLGLTYKDFYII